MSQLDYWWDLKKGRMLYKTDAELAKELNFGPKEIRNAKKKLIDSGLVKIIKKGIPQRSHYTLKVRVDDLLKTTVQPDNQQSPKRQHNETDKAAKSVPKGQANSCITQESTHKTTPEITTTSPRSKLSFDSKRLLFIFLGRWQEIVNENDWSLFLRWHDITPDLDTRIIAAIKRYGGVDELISELSERCEELAMSEQWRVENEQPVNLPFLLNAGA
ncbi:hypothetical protein [Endozoicomonas arenosclerae]|uniref:hypothetical protein n=1 Tax=Endozoicomonas arenosclerae TaxID=1633495 RepID=UPI00129473B5|nr:hypothetical protein [Endozoicomonas arenosclerae]